MSRMITEHLQSELVVLIGKRSENYTNIQVTCKDERLTTERYNLNIDRFSSFYQQNKNKQLL